MPLTNAGRDFIAGLITGHEATVFNNANARLGVGDGTTAFDVTQTDLQGANKFRKAMDSGFPTRLANVLTFKTTVLGAEANFSWQEWGVFNAASGGVMLNRKVEDNGAKISGQTWVFEVDITVNVG